MEKKRINYFDNLKVLLTLLVIAHHTCQAYTMGGDWSVKDSSNSAWLSSFLCVNMTFFMGAFFFISGYFVPRSLEHKKVGVFIKGRAKRLLLPILILLFMIVPAYDYIAYCYNEKQAVGFYQFYMQSYIGEGMISYDHGWFLISLFLYSVIYIPIRRLCDKVRGKLTGYKIIMFIAVMSLLTGIIRIVYPIDEWVNILGVIGIEPAHLPQYFLWFLAGTIAYKNEWLNELTDTTGKYCVAIGFFAAMLIYLQRILPYFIIDWIYDWFWVYECIMSVTIVIGLVYIFRKHFSSQGKLMKCLAQNAFTIYIVHNLFVIMMQVLMSKVKINVYLKFIVATTLAFTLSTIVAVVISKGKKRLKGHYV